MTCGRPTHRCDRPHPLAVRGAHERRLANLVGDVVVTTVNQIAAERISSWLLIAP
jgi:hypothetical protein